MERCPICRATLNGVETCRRCRAELQSIKRVERQGQVLVEAAIHSLSLDDVITAKRLLRRALVLHAAPEVRALWRLVTATSLPDA
jgi:ribosomal protein L34E